MPVNCVFYKNKKSSSTLSRNRTIQISNIDFLGEGNGDLLQVTLLLAEECRLSGRPKGKAAGPLATAAASIVVDYSSSDISHRPDILQNDGGSYGGSKSYLDLQDILKGKIGVL